MWLACPYLGRDVELTDERAAHIREHHPEVLPGRLELVQRSLSDPDEVRSRSWRPSQLLFVRHIAEFEFSVVATIEDEPSNVVDAPRTWVVTAYVSESPPLSTVVWRRP